MAAAQEALEWGRVALREEHFSRGDYRILLKLMLVYLGEEVDNFKIPRPCRVGDDKNILNFHLNLKIYMFEEMGYFLVPFRYPEPDLCRSASTTSP